MDDFRGRLRYEAAALQVSVGKAIADGSDIRDALLAWRERLAADFRAIVDMPPVFAELPANLKDYERNDFFEALQGLWESPERR